MLAMMFFSGTGGGDEDGDKQKLKSLNRKWRGLWMSTKVRAVIMTLTKSQYFTLIAEARILSEG